MRSRRWVTAILAPVIAVAATIGVVGISSGADDRAAPTARATEFSPKSLKDKWTGEWENLDFGSTGDIFANVKFNRTTEKFTPLVDFSGDVLGCPDPPADTITLKEGDGRNKWDEDGFKVVTDSEAFGDFKFVFKDDGDKVTASGNSPCNLSTTFTLTGKLTSSRFTGTVDIEFANAPGATAKLSAQQD